MTDTRAATCLIELTTGSVEFAPEPLIVLGELRDALVIQLPGRCYRNLLLGLLCHLAAQPLDLASKRVDLMVLGNQGLVIASRHRVSGRAGGLNLPAKQIPFVLELRERLLHLVYESVDVTDLVAGGATACHPEPDSANLFQGQAHLYSHTVEESLCPILRNPGHNVKVTLILHQIQRRSQHDTPGSERDPEDDVPEQVDDQEQHQHAQIQ